MLRDVLAQSPLLALPLTVLFLFLSVFLGAIVRAYGARAGTFDNVASLPLANDDASSETSS